MSGASQTTPADRTTLSRIMRALRLVTVPLPHLAGLAAAVRVDLDDRIPTMGIFASGRLVANPAFTARLSGDDLVFVLAHELPRRHGDRSKLFVYEVNMAETHRRRGIAKALHTRLADLARERGIRVGFVLTDADNAAGNALYRSVGGASREVVEWEFPYAVD